MQGAQQKLFQNLLFPIFTYLRYLISYLNLGFIVVDDFMGCNGGLIRTLLIDVSLETY
jgi:hypothetical protein